ncbi:hypothetical protein ACFQ3W_18910 [Paenibacillus puldeungensis]|uniref:Uncharacterized protein n=1 Tax=Paenibacillus puldeungensis TaxID=696536 RepID=A0ABW3S1T5_9BACL
MDSSNTKKNRIVELDVRPQLRSGQEPFQIIMEAFEQLADDHWKVTFQPEQ